MLTLGRLGCSSILAAAGIQRCKVTKRCVLVIRGLQVFNLRFPILGQSCRGEKRRDHSVFQEVDLLFLSQAQWSLSAPKRYLAGTNSLFLNFELILWEVSRLLRPVEMETGVCTEESELCLPGQPINSLLSASMAVSIDIFMEKYHNSTHLKGACPTPLWEDYEPQQPLHLKFVSHTYTLSL